MLSESMILNELYNSSYPMTYVDLKQIVLDFGHFDLNIRRVKDLPSVFKITFLYVHIII